MATLLCGGWMESVHGRRVVVVSGHGIHVGLSVSVGVDALLLRELDLRAGIWMGMATRRLEYLAGRSSVCCPSDRRLASSSGAFGHGEHIGGWQGWAGKHPGAVDANGSERRIGGSGNSARIVWEPASLKCSGREDGERGTASGSSVLCEFFACRWFGLQWRASGRQ